MILMWEIFIMEKQWNGQCEELHKNIHDIEKE